MCINVELSRVKRGLTAERRGEQACGATFDLDQSVAWDIGYTGYMATGENDMFITQQFTNNGDLDWTFASAVFDSAWRSAFMANASEAFDDFVKAYCAI